MPNLLVTLCNLAEPRPTALLLLDTETRNVTPVELGASTLIKSCTGLVRAGSRIYVLCADAEVRTYLAALDSSDYRPIFFQFLPEIIDGHSLLIKDDRIYIVSTGNDALIAYDLEQERASNPTLIWNIPDHSGTHHDTHHLNSIALWKGDILFTAFGAKSGQTWSTAANGYLYNLTRNATLPTRIYQPHSLKEWAGKLFYCESARGRIATISGFHLEIGGYTRGLDFVADDIVAVGSSIGRKVSKSTGFVNNPGDPGAKSGSCEISLIRLSQTKKPELICRISLANYGSEIYDLLSVANLQGERKIDESEKDFVGGGISIEGQPQLDAALLEQHQILSELKREQELKEGQLRQLTQSLKKIQEEYADSETKVARQQALLESMNPDNKTTLPDLFGIVSKTEPKHRKSSGNWLNKVFGKKT